MNSMRKETMKLTVLVVLVLLIGSSFAVVPAFATSTPSSTSTGGASSAVVTGATASVDVPVIAAAAGSPVIRTINITNPVGNPAITSIYISVPTAAFNTTAAASGAACPGGAALTATVYKTPCGGIASDSGTTGTTTTTGAGPWSVQFTNANGLVAPGSSVLLEISLVTQSDTSSGAANSYSLGISALDTASDTTVLPSVTIYETTSTAITLTGPTTTPGGATVPSTTAGSLFYVAASGVDSGLPLKVKVTGSVSSSPATAGSSTTTISPSSFTTTSSSQSITLNDTTAETITITVSGGHASSDDLGTGLLSNSIASFTITAGAPSALGILVTSFNANTYDVANEPAILNVTSFANGVVPGSAIQISATDKFGNTVTNLGTTKVGVTISTQLVKGRAATFNATSYSTAYPYNTGGGASATYPGKVAFSGTNTSVTLAANGVNYLVGVDYGSQSQIVASSNVSTIASAKSSTFQTFNMNSGSPSITFSQSGTTITGTGTVTDGAAVAGSGAVTVKATMGPTLQAGIPLYFVVDNTSTTYSGTFSNGGRQLQTYTTVSTSSNTASASSSLTIDNNATHFTNIEVIPVTPTAAGTVLNGSIASKVLQTQPGSLGSLKIVASFSKTDYSSTSTTSSVASGTHVYLDVSTSDAFGNPITTASVTRGVTLTATAGSFSVTNVNIPSGSSDTYASGAGSIIEYTAPSTIGSITVTATSGSTTGTKTLSIVSANPTITVTGPSTLSTTTLSSFVGYANTSLGLSGATIVGIQYSVNGASNQTIANSTGTSYEYSFQVTLTQASSVIVYAEEQAGNGNIYWGTANVLVPPIVSPAQTFSTPTGTTNQPHLYQFPNGGPMSVNSTFTNNGATPVTVIVVANVFTSSGIPLTPSPTATATVGSGATVQTFELLNGLAPGTYTVQVTVYSTSYVTYSSTYSVSVTIA